MEYSKALQIAENYKRIFSPFCLRIEIAGSIRRRRSIVNDIELVCVPKTTLIEDGMFEQKEIRDHKFVSLVNSFVRIKGSGKGKYTRIKLPGEDVYLDLFMTTAEQFGLIFMIRTGSYLFSKRMVTECKQRGYISDGGFLKKISGEVVPCYEEKDFFLYTGLQYIEPELRVF